MEKRFNYKGYVISSAPLPLAGGGFSSNRTIEQHTSTGVLDNILPDLQAKRFNTEEEAHDFYINEAKKMI